MINPIRVLTVAIVGSGLLIGTVGGGMAFADPLTANELFSRAQDAQARSGWADVAQYLVAYEQANPDYVDDDEHRSSVDASLSYALGKISDAFRDAAQLPQCRADLTVASGQAALGSKSSGIEHRPRLVPPKNGVTESKGAKSSSDETADMAATGKQWRRFRCPDTAAIGVIADAKNSEWTVGSTATLLGTKVDPSNSMLSCEFNLPIVHRLPEQFDECKADDRAFLCMPGQ